VPPLSSQAETPGPDRASGRSRWTFKEEDMSRIRRARWVGRLTGLGLVLAVLVPSAYAQFDRGRVGGFVRDEQGGVVPGATVKIINEQTKLERTYTTDNSGYYSAPALPPGVYQVVVELTGFKKFVRNGVKVDAASNVAVDAVLSAGGVEETVEVTASATPLQTNTGQVAKTVEAKQIQDIMLNGRNPINLAMLKPGVRGNNFNSFQPDSLTTGGFNINGSRSDENLITIDGAVATRTRSSGAIIGTVNVDTVSEMQVLTASYLPEYGRSSGGQVHGRQLLEPQQQPAGGPQQPPRAVHLSPVRLRHRRPGDHPGQVQRQP
jgi:hypothetical protein